MTTKALNSRTINAEEEVNSDETEEDIEGSKSSNEEHEHNDDVDDNMDINNY